MCPYSTTVQKVLDTPIVIEETGQVLGTVDVHKCSHSDQAADGLCILYQGEICGWFKRLNLS